MPRPINYIVKMRKWAKSTNGDDGLKLALLHTLNLYNTGKAKLEEVNKLVDKYSKTIQKEESSSDNSTDLEILAYLSEIKGF